MGRFATLAVLAAILALAVAQNLRSAAPRGCQEPLQKADTCCSNEPRLLPKAVFESCRAQVEGGSMDSAGRGDGSGKGDNSAHADSAIRAIDNSARGDMGPARGDNLPRDSPRGDNLPRDLPRDSPRGDSSARDSARGDSTLRGGDNVRRGDARPPVMKSAHKGSQQSGEKAVVLKVPFKAGFKNVMLRRKEDAQQPDPVPTSMSRKRWNYEASKTAGSDGGMRNNEEAPVKPERQKHPEQQAAKLGNPCIMDCAFKNQNFMTADGMIDPDAVVAGFLAELNLVAWKPLVRSGVDQCAKAIRDVDMSKAPAPGRRGPKCGWTAKFFMACMRQHIVGNCPRNFTDISDDTCADKFSDVKSCNPFEFPPAQSSQFSGRRTQDGALSPQLAQDQDEDYKAPPVDPNQQGVTSGRRNNMFTNRHRLQDAAVEEEDYAAPPVDPNQKGGSMGKRLNIFTNRPRSQEQPRPMQGQAANRDEDYKAPPADPNQKGVTMGRRLNIFTNLRGLKKSGADAAPAGPTPAAPQAQMNDEDEDDN